MIERTASELLALLNQGELTSEALVRECLETIRQREPKVGAFLRVEEEAALDQARAVDADRAAGKAVGALAGVPIALKDLLCLKGSPTTCASRMLEGFIPPYDAQAVTKLKRADAILIGKTNMDEFAMGSSTEHSAYHQTRNPWNPDYAPGGSSGGSAAAVASCEVPWALGTDTGGSIRQPASFCGVVGMKPTYGRVSRYGLIAYASSLDQIGTFSRDVRDTALLMEVIAGHDPRDSTSVNREVPKYAEALDEPMESLTIGVIKEHFDEGLDGEVEKAVREAVEVYKKLGATVKEVSLPHSKYAIAAYYLVATAEASSNLARYDGAQFGHRAEKHGDLIDMMKKSRGEGFGTEVKRRILLGTHALSTGYKDQYYLKALKVRRLIKDDFDEAFKECDVVLGPTSPTPAFKLGERSDDPLSMYLSDVCTVGCNLAGLPGISVPCGFSSSGLPIGLQLIAPPFAEEPLLRIARMYERETDWHQRRPELLV